MQLVVLHAGFVLWELIIPSLNAFKSQCPVSIQNQALILITGGIFNNGIQKDKEMESNTEILGADCHTIKPQSSECA